MKKYLAILALAPLTASAQDPVLIDLSSANFQAAVHRAAQQALQYEIDDAQWYQRHLERGGHSYTWGTQYSPQGEPRLQWDPGQ
jgi:hypothetical protein